MFIDSNEASWLKSITMLDVPVGAGEVPMNIESI
jgi:hypothetical protein